MSLMRVAVSGGRKGVTAAAVALPLLLRLSRQQHQSPSLTSHALHSLHQCINQAADSAASCSSTGSVNASMNSKSRIDDCWHEGRSRKGTGNRKFRLQERGSRRLHSGRQATGRKRLNRMENESGTLQLLHCAFVFIATINRRLRRQMPWLITSDDDREAWPI